MDIYPPKDDQTRLQNYDLYEKIFLGEHYDAFNIVSKDFKKDYAMLRYVACNFGGMISKLSADMLFEEFPKFTVEEGDQSFVDALIGKTKVQIYESGLEQSYSGDVLYRIRAVNGECVLEDINPAYYFPEYNPDNVRAEPTAHVLAWKVKLAGRKNDGVFFEKHYKGKIVNELWELNEAGELVTQLPVNEYLTNKDGTPKQPVVQTNIDDFLIIHIKNFGIRTRYWGISDYKDLIPLFMAVNNRVTKIDNILDKHGEPILAVPDGVLDEDGRVRRGAFGVIEVDSTASGGQMPQYIVWDAKLESAFDEIDRLVEFLLLFSENNKTSFGIDEGGNIESGKALKFKLLRTIAKKHRKEIYYDIGLKRAILVAQKFAKANKLKVDGIAVTKDPVQPIIDWQDGVINDPTEQLDIEERSVDAGFTTTVEAISNLDGITRKEAEKKLKEIKKEKEENMPKFTANPLVVPNQNGKGDSGVIPPNK